MGIDVFLSNLWRWKCGIPEIHSTKIASLDELRQTEWSSEFEGLMKNRLIMGAIRYGRINEKNKPQYDRVKSMQTKLSLYQQTGNMETLVDIANLCLLEFTECNHPTKHFHAFDESEHTKPIIYL